MKDIKKVAVIGSGVMGAGIAAHFANAGVEVLLLDVPQSGFGKKNALAEGAIERLLKTDPAPLMHKKNVKLIKAGNLESDLDQLKDVDWVVEAIIEKLEIKQDLYKKIAQVKRPDAVVSSNTSTIPLGKLMEGMPEEFQQTFMITHFFNPPRYMKLLEIVKGPKTRLDLYEGIKTFSDYRLGKGVVECKDTPGFLANRIGIYWLQVAMIGAFEHKMSVEEADALLGKPMGIPKMGVFGLLDLVGLDLIPLIGGIMKSTLPAHDPYCQGYREPELFKKMIADGYTGRKGKGGFYRLNTDNGGKIKESINLETGLYSPSLKATLSSLSAAKKDLKAMLTHPDRGGKFSWEVLSKVLSYAASLVPEVSDSIVAIDSAMKWGYNWKYGPFELIDKLGASWMAQRLKEEGREIPQILSQVKGDSFYKVIDGQLHAFNGKGQYEPIRRSPGQLLLSDIKLTTKPLAKNASASLWDIGDGVACLEFHSKMNAIDPEIMKMIRQSIEIVGRSYKALVIYNEGSNFSAGANLGLALFVANIGLWQSIEEIVKEGQDAYQALKYSSFPVVGAPSGMALGGGCEVLLHCDAVQAHAETYIGLVEVGVGLVPAWGGCKEMITRWLTNGKRAGGSMVAIGKVFEMIATAFVAKSAEEAKEALFFRSEDNITMNRDRLLFDAKQKALTLAQTYQVPVEDKLSLPGSVARVALTMAVKGFVKIGKATAYDEFISKKLAYILSGGDTDVTDEKGAESLLEMERSAFMELVKNPKTLARMEHILETGKPLRN